MNRREHQSTTTEATAPARSRARITPSWSKRLPPDHPLRLAVKAAPVAVKTPEAARRPVEVPTGLERVREYETQRNAAQAARAARKQRIKRATLAAAHARRIGEHLEALASLEQSVAHLAPFVPLAVPTVEESRAPWERIEWPPVEPPVTAALSTSTLTAAPPRTCAPVPRPAL